MSSDHTGDYAAFTRFVAHRDDTQLPYLRIVQDEDADEVKLPRCWLLDAPSDPNPLLDQLMKDALLAIYLRSDGATMSIGERVSRGKSADSMAPRSGLAQEIAVLERSYNASRTHRARLRVIKDAQGVVKSLRYAQKANPSRVRGTVEWRMRIAKDTRPRRVVAAEFRVSSKTITAARKEFGEEEGTTMRGLAK